MVPIERITHAIPFIRGHKVILVSDLAELYGVATKVLIQAVKRNIDPFPDDFMFQLTQQELGNVRSQFVTSSWVNAPSPPHPSPPATLAGTLNPGVPA